MNTNLEILFDNMNISKKELADKIGVSRQQINSWISKNDSKRPIPMKHKKAISNLFGVDEEYLEEIIDEKATLKFYEEYVSKRLGKKVKIIIE